MKKHTTNGVFYEIALYKTISNLGDSVNYLTLDIWYNKNTKFASKNKK